MNKIDSLTWIHQTWANCQGCGLCQERNNVVFGDGNPDAQIMIIGEAPGETEDRSGLPFVGAAGQLLDLYLGQASWKEEIHELIEHINTSRSANDKAGFRYNLRENLLEDIYFTNVVMCRPPDNRDPIPKEIEACRSRLLEQIYIVDPVIILTAGRIATEAIIGKKVSITQTRGELFDVEIPGKLHSDIRIRYPVLAILHPSYLLRKNDFKQRGGDGQKTYNDFIRTMNVIDKYNENHFGMPIPSTRPKKEER
jgi:uracil-DNA glycosylase family 4